MNVGGGLLPSYEKRMKSPEDLEGQSEERLEGLFGKVRMLKDVCALSLFFLFFWGGGGVCSTCVLFFVSLVGK